VCNQVLDVAFILDASVSVGASNWNFLTNYVNNFLNQLNIGSNLVQVAFVKFADSSSSQGQGVIFNFNMYNTRLAIQTAFSGESYQTGRETNLIDALSKTRTTVFTSANGARIGQSNVRQVAIVFSDGFSDDPGNVNNQITLLKNQGVYIVAVAVATQFSQTTLTSQFTSFVSTSSELLIASDFTQLSTVTTNLVTYSCVAPLPVGKTIKVPFSL